MKNNISVFIITVVFLCLCSCNPFINKKHKMDGMWEYQSTSYELIDSISIELRDSVLNLIKEKRSENWKHLIMIQDGELKVGYIEDELDKYYIEPFAQPYQVDTLLYKQDTLYFFVTPGEVACLKYVDENKVEQYLTSTLDIGEHFDIRYNIIRHFSRLKDETKIGYYNYTNIK